MSRGADLSGFAAGGLLRARGGRRHQRLPRRFFGRHGGPRAQSVCRVRRGPRARAALLRSSLPIPVKFWLGTHETSWLTKTSVPLMISHRRLSLRKQLPRAVGPWVLDSGGYSELSLFGGWQTTPQTYVGAVRRYMDEIGMLEWAAVQDWMCEPWVLDKTGFDVLEHQYRSVVSYLELRLRAPEIPWVPVLQGW